nr:GNAT family N-acetyltransferase [Haloferax gibbonsii]
MVGVPSLSDCPHPPTTAERAAVRRYIEDLWVPYNRELEGIVDSFSLATDVDIVAKELEHRLSRHETESYQAWIAVDGSHDESDLADTSGDFVGFITTDIDESPTVFDRPDRLVICDIYIKEPYRGTGLSRDLVEYAKRRAMKVGAPNSNSKSTWRMNMLSRSMKNSALSPLVTPWLPA